VDVVPEQAIRVVPAGWYEDPASTSRVRWWNGLAWTDHTAAKPANPAPAGAAGADDQVATDSLEHAAATAITGAAWFIALSPVLTGLAVTVAGYLAFYVWRFPRLFEIPVVWVTAAIPLLLATVAAFVDARRLGRAGHAPPTPAWSLLGPLVYLVARRRRVPGSAPLVVFCLLGAIVVAGPVAAVLTGAAGPVTKALEIQETLSADLVGSNGVTAVSCPPLIASTAAGTTYDCDATMTDGTSRTVRVSFSGDDGTYRHSLSVR
jgi:hypothetical protein